MSCCLAQVAGPGARRVEPERRGGDRADASGLASITRPLCVSIVATCQEPKTKPFGSHLTAKRHADGTDAKYCLFDVARTFLTKPIRFLTGLLSHRNATTASTLSVHSKGRPFLSKAVALKTDRLPWVDVRRRRLEVGAEGPVVDEAAAVDRLVVHAVLLHQQPRLRLRHRLKKRPAFDESTRIDNGLCEELQGLLRSRGSCVSPARASRAPA